MEQALALAKEIGSRDVETNIHGVMAQALAAAGDYAAAYRHERLFRIMGDTLLNEASTNQMQEARVQFETEQAENRARLEAAALPIYERGHLPMLGEWLALPIIHAAGGQTPGDAVFHAYQNPVAERLLLRCDAVLRLPGASRGADMDVARARARGLPVVHHVDELPLRTPASRAAEATL